MFLKKGMVVCRRAGSRLMVLLIVACCANACTASNSFRERLYPKPPPTAADIGQDYSSFNQALNDISKAAGATLSREEAVTAYVATGYDMAEKACFDFFVKVRQVRNDTEFTKDAMRNVLASAGLITALATGPTSVLAGLFGATGAGPTVASDFENTFLFADASDSLYPQIFSVMLEYRSTFKATDRTKVDVLTAEMRVRQHAALCSLPFLAYVVKKGVKEVKIETMKGTTASAGAVPLGKMEAK